MGVDRQSSVCMFGISITKYIKAHSAFYVLLLSHGKALGQSTDQLHCAKSVLLSILNCFFVECDDHLEIQSIYYTLSQCWAKVVLLICTFAPSVQKANHVVVQALDNQTASDCSDEVDGAFVRKYVSIKPTKKLQ